ncbi:MAG: endolytic transglycosylase MltG [Chitinophagales bacterium]|nr:endolytic transglycosylase MltG [Chitinophagales bacterium]
MKKAITFFVLLVTIALLSGAVATYVFLIDNVQVAGQLQRAISIKIPTGSSYADVLQLLKEKNALKNYQTFEWTCRIKGYDKKIRSGHYVLRSGMGNRALVNLLKGGLQTPVQLVIYNIRTKNEFAGLVGRTLELDSVSLLQKLSNIDFCKKYNTDTNNILSQFIVDNYEFYWNVSEDMFFEKMQRAYNDFWNSNRKKNAASLHLTELQVTTLASIVEKEVIFDKEMVTVAGVYLNRLRINMPLQADPTLVFARRDFTAKRVTAYHKEFDSPYNTYKYPGLPPGPICMPRKKSIDAVLQAESHKYLYFCANPDLSGYSIFSESYEDQMRVAAMYRKKLNAMNIR